MLSVSPIENRPGKEQVKLTAAEIYRRCVDGDDAAWRYLYSWCVKQARTLSMHEAEDVAQQVCLKLLDGGLKKVREPSSFLAFTRRAVKNQFIDQYRKSSRMDSLDQSPAGSDDPADNRMEHIPSTNPLPGDQAEARILLCRLEALIANLPDYCAMVMQAYVKYRLGLLDGYTSMAEVLEIPLGTLSVRIKRCLAELRRFPEFADLGG